METSEQWDDEYSMIYLIEEHLCSEKDKSTKQSNLTKQVAHDTGSMHDK